MKGFTLVEMLTALAVFGLVAAAGVAVMGQTIDTQTAVRGRMDRTGEFQRGRAVIRADIEQAVMRRTRGEDGAASPAAFRGGGDVLMAFVRGGWSNPDGAARASLQYVEYRWEGGRLERRVRPALDGAALGAPQVVISGVRTAEVAFLTRGEWLPAWSGGPGVGLPEAVRLELELDGVGQVTQLFLAPGHAR